MSKIKSGSVLFLGKIYILLFLCVVTCGATSAFISKQTKSIFASYLDSNENPAKQLLAFKRESEITPLDFKQRGEQEVALVEAAKKISSIKERSLVIDALSQLLIIFLYALLISKLIKARYSHE